MGRSHRRIVKCGAWAFGAIAVLIGLYLSPFFFPYPMFRHHVQAAGFDVYADREIPESFMNTLEDARRRVEAMPLYREEALPRIFVCHSRRRFAFLVKLAGKKRAGQGLLVPAAGNAFFSAQGIEAVARRRDARPARSRLEGSWAGAIAHEVAHHLMYAEVGFRGTRRMPAWKAEGYADYTTHLADIGSAPEREILDRVALIADDTVWQGPTGAIDRRHFRWQVMVEYLCEVKGLDLAGLLAEDVTEPRTWAELMAWGRSE